MTDEVLAELGLSRDELSEEKAIEVGNIFSLGFKFSEPFRLTYKDNEGNDIPVFMGSYGIGITRLMGAIVEAMHDDRGICWPAAVAPFRVHLVSLGQSERAEQLYQQLTAAGVEVLYDDRDALSAGEKFADADLIGCPVRVTIGSKTPEGQLEYRLRSEPEHQLISEEELLKLLKN
jgi:prolyl-tRNA synthetase